MWETCKKRQSLGKGGGRKWKKQEIGSWLGTDYAIYATLTWHSAILCSVRKSAAKNRSVSEHG